jgi:hypothetical protein
MKPTDKQLCDINLADVLEKRELDQALNAKEFAVLAGISYSVAREWFNMKGFPRVQGVVFWQDFVAWRNAQNRGTQSPNHSFHPAPPNNVSESKRPSSAGLPARAAQILQDAVK